MGLILYNPECQFKCRQFFCEYQFIPSYKDMNNKSKGGNGGQRKGSSDVIDSIVKNIPGQDKNAERSPILREKVKNEFIQNPLFKQLMETLHDRNEMSKYAKKFGQSDDIDQMLNHLPSDEYDLEKLRREFEREAEIMGTSNSSQRRKFRELDELESDPEYQKMQKKLANRQIMEGSLKKYFKQAIKNKRKEYRKENQGDDDMVENILSNQMQLKEALGMGVKKRYFKNGLEVQTGFNSREGSVIQSVATTPGMLEGSTGQVSSITKQAGLQSPEDEKIEQNMKEQGASEQDIEEFKKLKKYSSEYRLRHVYRLYNEFKYQLNGSMTGFADPKAIQEWSDSFNYDNYLLEQEKAEQEEKEKRAILETMKAEATAKMMGSLTSKIRAQVHEELQLGLTTGSFDPKPNQAAADNQVKVINQVVAQGKDDSADTFLPRPQTSQLTGQSALAVESEFKSKLKELDAMGLELSEQSGIKTPESEEVSVDSFKQLDPRSKFFSFRKLRLEQEKQRREEEGGRISTDANFKNFKFKHLKGFEDIDENNMEKYKKLKKLEQRKAKKRIRTLSLGSSKIDEKIKTLDQQITELDKEQVEEQQPSESISEPNLTDLDSPEKMKRSKLRGLKRDTKIDVGKMERLDKIRMAYRGKGNVDQVQNAEISVDQTSREGDAGQPCEHCGRKGGKHMEDQQSGHDSDPQMTSFDDKLTSTLDQRQSKGKRDTQQSPADSAEQVSNQKGAKPGLNKGMEDNVKNRVAEGLKKQFTMKPKKVQQQQPAPTRQEQKIQEVRQIQSQIRADVEAYPELKVPVEFIAKFEHDKKMNAGSVMYAPRDVQDEMRIRYLQQMANQLEECHDRDMKDIELKLRSKMHVYVKKCLDQIQTDLTDQFKLIFVQLDKVCEKEKVQRRIIYELKSAMQYQEQIITDLAEFGQWEETEHERFTQGLKDEGLIPEKIQKTTDEIAAEKSTLGLKRFYERIKDVTPRERESIEMAKPFGLYSGSVRLKLHERLNILERETVRIYQDRVTELKNELEVYHSQSDDLNIFQDILAQEKKDLEDLVARLEEQLKKEQALRAHDNATFQERIKDTVADYELQIQSLSRDAEELYKLFVKELALKDNLLDQTTQMKDVLLDKTKKLTIKLKTPRHHLQFLAEKGMLDPFVSAKLTGEDVYAKWILKKSAKKEITELVGYHATKQKEFAKRNIDVDEFNYLKKPKNTKAEATAAEDQLQHRYMVSSSFVNQLEREASKKIVNIEFREVPAQQNPLLNKNTSTSISVSDPKSTLHDGMVSHKLGSLQGYNNSSLYSNEQTAVDRTFHTNTNDPQSQVHPIQIHNQTAENAVFPTYRGAKTQRPEEESPKQKQKVDNLGSAGSSHLANVFIFKSNEEPFKNVTLDNSLLQSVIHETSPDQSKSPHSRSPGMSYKNSDVYNSIRIVQKKRERGSLANGIRGVNLAPKLDCKSKKTEDRAISYKVGGSLIVGKLERKGSFWEGGFKNDANQFEMKRKVSAFFSTDEQMKPISTDPVPPIMQKNKTRFAGTAQPGYRFNKNESHIDQNALQSEDELLDDAHLKKKIESDRQYKNTCVTQSQFQMQFNNPIYQTIKSNNNLTKTNYQISSQEQARQYQLGKPLSTRDYFSKNTIENKQVGGYYVKKPMLLELGSSKKTRPSNIENSMGPQSNNYSIYKFDKYKIIKDTDNVSPEQPLSAQLNPRGSLGVKPTIYSKFDNLVDGRTKSGQIGEKFVNKRVNTKQMNNGYQTHRTSNFKNAQQIDGKVIQASLSPTNYNGISPMNFLSARTSEVRSTVYQELKQVQQHTTATSGSAVAPNILSSSQEMQARKDLGGATGMPVDEQNDSLEARFMHNQQSQHD